MVRLPKEERRLEHVFEEMMIRTPAGGEMPLREAAEVRRARAYTEIQRANGQRVVHVTADVVPRSATSRIMAALRTDLLPELKQRYRGLTHSFEGAQRDMTDSLRSLGKGFALAMVAIFAMVAIPFRSYLQPLIVMACIPFGIVGAVLGHILMGYNLSIVSMMGIVALSGVVVNDSLILIHYANGRRQEGAGPLEAIAEAGARRFRPILLTSLTTFGGLAPMIFETSLQARFLIPMALSLGYGILFATAITLVLVPSLYLIVEDLRDAASGLGRALSSPARRAMPVAAKSVARR